MVVPRARQTAAEGMPSPTAVVLCAVVVLALCGEGGAGGRGKGHGRDQSHLSQSDMLHGARALPLASGYSVHTAPKRIL